MGNSLYSLYYWAFPRKSTRIINMFSLDAAGKTTILYKLKLGHAVTTIPTIGFNVETVTWNNITFQVWDVGGGDKIRPLWRHYLQGVDGVIFVVDSKDVERMAEARDALHSYILQIQESGDVPLLVFANKQDLAGAVTGMDVEKGLELDKIRNRRWHVEPSNALLGVGLNLGLNWLAKEISGE